MIAAACKLRVDALVHVQLWCGDNGRTKKDNVNVSSDRLTTWDDDSGCWIELTVSPSLDGAPFVSELVATIP